MLTQEQLNEIKAFNRNVKWLRERAKEEKERDRGGALEVQKLTGWNAEQMRRAREMGLVKWEREGKSIIYYLSSINPIHHLKNQS